ncbi:hypothetical protein Enr10x_14150 [Gimesia panareensis]|uniref:Uncharacterized protein n=1 Tax=Gimesia panareensis TaxID=2527978 RepID=A0A517Q3A7_9PLAN|nr:hypothetical protein Enr10x_14150 [Gimesia panareensis]
MDVVAENVYIRVALVMNTGDPIINFIVLDRDVVVISIICGEHTTTFDSRSRAFQNIVLDRMPRGAGSHEDGRFTTNAGRTGPIDDLESVNHDIVRKETKPAGQFTFRAADTRVNPRSNPGIGTLDRHSFVNVDVTGVCSIFNFENSVGCDQIDSLLNSIGGTSLTAKGSHMQCGEVTLETCGHQVGIGAVVEERCEVDHEWCAAICVFH